MFGIGAWLSSSHRNHHLRDFIMTWTNNALMFNVRAKSLILRIINVRERLIRNSIQWMDAHCILHTYTAVSSSHPLPLLRSICSITSIGDDYWSQHNGLGFWILFWRLSSPIRSTACSTEYFSGIAIALPICACVCLSEMRHNNGKIVCQHSYTTQFYFCIILSAHALTYDSYTCECCRSLRNAGKPKPKPKKERRRRREKTNNNNRNLSVSL